MTNEGDTSEPSVREGSTAPAQSRWEGRSFGVSLLALAVALVGTFLAHREPMPRETKPMRPATRPPRRGTKQPRRARTLHSLASRSRRRPPLKRVASRSPRRTPFDTQLTLRNASTLPIRDVTLYLVGDLGFGSGLPALLVSGVASPWRASERLTEDQITELIARYESGESSRALAADFGLGKTSIVRLLRSRGVQIRRRGRALDSWAASCHGSGGLGCSASAMASRVKSGSGFTTDSTVSTRSVPEGRRVCVLDLRGLTPAQPTNTPFAGGLLSERSDKRLILNYTFKSRSRLQCSGEVKIRNPIDGLPRAEHSSAIRKQTHDSLYA